MALVVDQGSNPFEMGCACEVFGARRRPEIGFELYDLTVVSPTRVTTMRDGLFRLSADAGLEALAEADIVIVPNRPDVLEPSRPALLAQIRDAHVRGARLVGLCTGAFTLAEAGILDGRRVTVHWQLIDEFVQRFPNIQVQPDVLFVDDGDVLTSAGSAAALDLALHIVRADYGAEVANYVSRRLVFSAFREGGQRQFVDRAVPAATDSSLASTLAWAGERLEKSLTVRDLARHAHTSVTSFHRRFQAETGTTPLAWLTTQRLQFAQRLLERTEFPLDAVARQAGLGTAANLRALMRRHVGVTPSSYRRQFSSGQ
ncbi:helix-turn-helix domain-containing protein [Mycobacterium sp. 21AC1]|uniref:GlxA family transcriptional regulator n=1 Tax=[Mycobacterium] appelbergii TaxID=2939269 RepID=UPI00293921DC|nr:helix-turn-helix domain-containing protein [Mycobacterium sp. 21AC1]MDV3123591.1 helix-turn-helix domain-containing protein [Mycobacterium sp. 21AC1]